MVEEVEVKNTTALENYRVLLIDLENCPSQIHRLPNDLDGFSQVVICYANNGPKVPLDWLPPLAAALNSSKLKISKMEHPGKNSADFGICFFAGMLMQSSPKEAHFVIVSNDADLDYTVSLLKSQGRSAERIGAKNEQKEVAVPGAIHTTLVQTYCAHLITHSKTRLAKKDTLLKSIKNTFKDRPSTADEMFNSLVLRAAVRIVQNKVDYDDKK